MRQFPLRLTADLAIARLAQRSPGNANSSLALPLNPVQQRGLSGFGAVNDSAGAIAGTELLACVRQSSAPVVWIGGGEPLLHPEMGQLTRCIAGIGRHVFLETDGALLRRRIHEFRPVSRLFLTLRLDGLESSHDLRAGRAGAFRAALEGLRAARLSGFLLCVHARISLDAQLAEIAELIQLARSFDVDGFVISPAEGAPDFASRRGETLRRKTAEARKLIGNFWWEFFSRLMEPVLTGCPSPARMIEGARLGLKHEADKSEEGVEIA